MKLAFMGSDAIALPMLRYLRSKKPAGVEVTTVFTQPDRKTGRGMRLKANAIKQWALEEGLEVHQPVKCSQDDAGLLKQLEIDVVLVMAYGQILPRSVLDACPKGTLNIHGSLLPRLRGASPIQTAVALGLQETGVSLMRVVPKLDSGPVAAQERVAILPDETSRSLIEKLSLSCIPLMEKALPQLAEDMLEYKEQTPDEVTYCRIIDKTDAYLDFSRPAAELVDRIRAFQPWPGIVFPYEGQDLRIHSAETVDAPESHPGMLAQDRDGNLCIACKEGALKPLLLQRAGGRPMKTREFLRGFPLRIGYTVESREMRILEQTVPFPYRKKRIPEA